MLKYDEGLKSYILSHPYDIKTKEILAGEAAFDPIDVKSVFEVSKDEFLEWEKKYVVFRNSVIKEKGYDACEIDVKDLEISLKMDVCILEQMQLMLLLQNNMLKNLQLNLMKNVQLME